MTWLQSWPRYYDEKNHGRSFGILTRDAQRRIRLRRDGGKTWKLLHRGLPERDAHVTVLSEAMIPIRYRPRACASGPPPELLITRATPGRVGRFSRKACLPSIP
jgi:hypothetical protein